MFFCDKEDSTENLTKAQTFKLDRKVRDAANQLCDEMLLAKLSEGDMIAIEALYHKSCLSALYNRVRDLQTTKPKADSENAIIEGMVLRHSAALETPFPLFIGLLLHAKTRKKGLLNTLAQKGLSFSYKRVQDVQLNVTKELCKKYSEDSFVCPPSLKEGVCTTAAVDNIDHNLSSTTATKSFHGTSISVFQHPEKALEPNQFDISVDFEDSCTKIELPESYTNLLPTKSKAAEYPLQTVNGEKALNVQPMDETSEWLKHLMEMNGEDDDIKTGSLGQVFTQGSLKFAHSKLPQRCCPT